MPPGRRRAVVLVGGPAAPYSRALRVARELSAEGFEVEIAAVAAAGLPEVERQGPATIRRYRSRGPWSILGWSRRLRDGARSAGRTEFSAAGQNRIRPSCSWRASGSWLARAVRLAVEPALVLRRWLLWPHAVRGWWAALGRDLRAADLYHACGALTVQPALAARRRYPRGPSGLPARVVYDVVDDALHGNAALGMPHLVRAWHARREAAWAAEADALLTVNAALADRLARRWGRPVGVLPNIPELPDVGLIGRPQDRIREALGLARTQPVVLFQGRLGPGLGIENLEEAVVRLSGVVLVFLGFGVGYDAVRARDEEPRFQGRHFTLPAVPPDEVLSWTASADAVAIPLPPISINQRLSTPNKFWEAVVVGTPVVVPAGLTVLADLVRAHDLGVVARSERPDDLAEALRAVLNRLAGERGAWRHRIAATVAREFDPRPKWDRYRATVARLVGPADGG